MFSSNGTKNKNKIIDGAFAVDRYVTVSIGGQIHSRKVKQDDKGVCYIEYEGKTFVLDDFADNND